jgi:hypothetical protein
VGGVFDGENVDEGEKVLVDGSSVDIELPDRLLAVRVTIIASKK